MVEWRKVEGMEYEYYVSSEGQVYSSSYDRLLAQHMINSGYLVVSMREQGDNSNKNMLVHRVVAKAFCEGYSEELDVNHKNANRLDNRSSNLEWVTRKENIHDCMRRGVHDIKSAHKVAHEKRKRPVRQYNLNGDLVNEYGSAREASKVVGTHENNISRAARGERLTTVGYKWEYIS